MRVLFLDATGGFYPRRLEEKPTGGILTSLTLIPRYLASLGIDVHVASTYDRVEEYMGVKYVEKPIAENIYDVVVLNRNVIDKDIIQFFRASRIVWWLHDIVDHRYLEDDGYRSVDDIVALSEYCKRSYSDFYGIPLNKFHVIPNGVDRKVFYPGKEARDGPRDGNLFVCASAPIKGAYPLEYTFMNLRRINPRAEIRMYSSQAIHGLENTEGMSKMLEAMRSVGITVLDPVPQAELADVMRKACAFLMPGHYPELCSNSLLQALACGTPVIGSPIASIPEFVKHRFNGLLTETGPADHYWWWKQFAVQCATIMTDKDLREKLSSNASWGPMSWDQIGNRWVQILTSKPSRKELAHA